MVEAKKILQKINRFDQLKRSGLTDDEIEELTGWRQEEEDRQFVYKRSISRAEEMDDLQRKLDTGEINQEEEERLDKGLGVIYTKEIFGQKYKVNHCMIARLIMGGFVLVAVAFMVYISSFSGLEI